MSPSLKRTRAGPSGRLRRGLAAALLAAVGSITLTAQPALASSGSASGTGAAPVGTAAVAAPAAVAPASPASPASPDVVSPVGAVAQSQPTLRQGSTGHWVLRMQRRLHGLGYDVGPMDGKFGPRTHHGVVAFQKVHNLPRDGVVGPSTWAKMARPLTLKPRYYHPGLSVQVNLSKQVLFLARGNQVWRVFDASTGTAQTPTPQGHFTDIRQIDGWRRSSLGLLWRPHYFYGGYAIHGSRSVPNYPASHGCVRVTIDHMNWLWLYMRTGMPIHVYAR